MVANLAYFELSEITNKDGFRVYYENGKWSGEQVASQSIASYYQLGRYASMYPIDPRADPRMFARQPLQREIFDSLFCHLLRRNEGRIPAAQPCGGDQEHRRVQGRQLRHLARAELVRLRDATVGDLACFPGRNASNREFPDGSRRVSGDRRNTLTGRDYPISVVSNLLELSGTLPFETFRTVDAVRGYRNKVVHQDPGFSCGPVHCQQAIGLALELALKDSDIRVTPNLGFSVSG